jgi:hypothetical protein
MAQWRKDIQEYDGQSTRHEVYIRADQYGNLLGEGATHRSAFGEPISVPITPVIQADALYGLPTRKFETFTASGGTANTTPTLLEQISVDMVLFAPDRS